MRYYILYPDNTEADTINDINQLGDDNGFGVFWGARGLVILMNLIKTDPEKLELITIVNEKGNKLSITKFLDSIQDLKVRYN